MAAIGQDLSAQVLTGAPRPNGATSVRVGSAPVLPGSSTMLNMLLLRYPGKDTARRQLARARSEGRKDGQAVKTELVFEAPEHGRLKVSDPTPGSAAMSRSDLISWGLFGLPRPQQAGQIPGLACRLGSGTAGWLRYLPGEPAGTPHHEHHDRRDGRHRRRNHRPAPRKGK